MKSKFPFGLMRLRKGKSASDIERMFSNREMPIVQKKYDGHLVQIEKKSGKVKVASRRGKDLTSRLKPIVSKLSKQISDPGVYIGELIVKKGGKHQLYDVQSIVSSKPARANEFVKSHDVRIALFDKIFDGASSMAAAPYRDRMSELRTSVKSGGPAFVVKNYDWDNLDKAMKSSLKEGGEGVVIKDPDGAYKITDPDSTERKGSQWKLKAPGVKDQSDDFLLIDYRKGKEKLIFDAAQYDDGELYIVGKLSGLDKQTEKSVAKKIDKGENVVAEASFQERLPSGKYRHLAWVRLRPDKPEKSVTMTKKNPVQSLIEERLLRNPDHDQEGFSDEFDDDDFEEFLDVLPSGVDAPVSPYVFATDSDHRLQVKKRPTPRSGIRPEIPVREETVADRLRETVRSFGPGDQIRSSVRRRGSVMLEELGDLCAPVRDLYGFVAKDQYLLKVTKDSWGDQMLVARIVQDEQTGRWVGHLYREEEMPVVYQYLSAQNARALLDRAPLSMSVLGCDSKFIGDYRALDREDDVGRLMAWGTWFASFRLLPWMMNAQNLGAIQECQEVRQPYIYSLTGDLYGPELGPVFALGDVMPSQAKEELNVRVETVRYVRGRYSAMEEGDGLFVVPWGDEDLDADTLERFDFARDCLAAAAMTYTNSVSYVDELLKDKAALSQSRDPQRFLNVLRGPESPYGVVLDHIVREDASLKGDFLGVPFWGGVTDVNLELTGRAAEEIQDPSIGPDDVPADLLEGRYEEGTEVDFGEEGMSIGWEVNPSDRSMDSLFPGFTYSLTPISRIQEDGLDSAAGIAALIFHQKFPEQRAPYLKSDFPYVTGISSPGLDAFREMKFRVNAIEYGRRGVEQGSVYYVSYTVPGFDFTNPAYSTESMMSYEDVEDYIQSNADEAFRLRMNPRQLPPRGFQDVDSVMDRSLAIDRGIWNGQVFAYDPRLREVVQMPISQALRLERDTKSVLGIKEGDARPFFIQALRGFELSGEDIEQGDIFSVSAIVDEDGAFVYDLVRYSETGPVAVSNVQEGEMRELLKSKPPFVQIIGRRSDEDALFVAGETDEGEDLFLRFSSEDQGGIRRGEEFRVEWMKVGPEGTTAKTDREVNRLLGSDALWYVLIVDDSGNGFPILVDDAIYNFVPIEEDGEPTAWPSRLFESRNLKKFIPGDVSYDDMVSIARGDFEDDVMGVDTAPGRNPCLGLHVHSDDLDKIKDLIEVRQNPGFVSRMVKRHKELGEK